MKVLSDFFILRRILFTTKHENKNENHETNRDNRAVVPIYP